MKNLLIRRLQGIALTGSALLAVLILGLFISPILKGQFAAAFSSSAPGDWNNPVTWGVSVPNGVTYYSGFTFPQDLAVAPTGEIYVANSDANQIKILNSDGTASTTYATGEQAYAVAFGLNSEIYVGLANIGSVLVLNPDGTASTTWGGLGSPQALRVSKTGEIYVLDAGGFIRILNPDGTASTTYSDPSFAYPRALAISSTTGEIFVANRDNALITVLNADGTASTTFDGGSLAPFNQPFGVALNEETRELYVSDRLNNRIVVLNGDGSASTTLSGMSLNNPHNIIRQPDGHIYIANTFSNNIVSYDPGFVYVPAAGVDYPGPNDDVSIHSVVTLSQDEAVHTITINPGTTFNLNGYTLSVSGDWTNNGTFLASSGTVEFVATTSQLIIGNNTFHNLIKTSATPNNGLQFDTLSVTNITGDLTVQGAPGALLDFGVPGTAPVYAQTLQFGVSGAGVGELMSVASIVFDDDGYMYVGEQGPRFQKFDADLISILQVGSGGIGPGQFCGSVKVALDSAGNIYAADSCNRVQKFDPSGSFMWQIGSTSPSSGSGTGEFNNIQGLDLDSQDYIYVVDQGNTRIQKFDSDGNFIMTFGSSGPGDGQFFAPYGIAINSQDILHVVDIAQSRVQTFDTDGNFITAFGSSGPGEGEFAGASKISVDASDNIYVGEWGNDRIQKFDGSGVFIHALSGSSFFSSISAIAFDSAGAMWVGNTNITPYIRKFISNFDNVAHISVLGSAELSYLSVLGLINDGSVDLECLIGCINLGGNVKWKFPLPTYGGGISSVSVGGDTLSEPEATTSEEAATSTATTTTPQTATSTISTPLPTVVTPVPKQPEPQLPELPQIPEQPELPQVTDTQIPTPVNQIEFVIPEIGFLNSVKAIFESSFAELSQIFLAVSETVREIITSPEGSLTTKIIATTGAIAGAVALASTIAFANPVTVGELFLMPSRLLALALGALGIKRKNRPWGTVYDSVTKRPLDPAYVTLTDATTGKEVAQATTDLDGRYSFLVPPGTYILKAQKTNYVPSTKLAGKLFDEVYNDLYFGTPFTITQPGEVITKNIPLDPQNFDWNEFAKAHMSVNSFTTGSTVLWARISKTLFALGSTIALLAVIFAPEPYNLVIAGVYLLVHLTNYTVLAKARPGKLIEATTGLPLSFAIVKVFRAGETEPILKKITDAAGNYFTLVPPGDYYLSVEKKIGESAYTPIYTSPVAHIEKGVVNETLKV